MKEAERKVREMERVWEKRERQERRKNLVIKGFKEEGKGAEARVKEIFEQIGARAEVEEVRVVRTGKEERGEMAVVRMRTEEGRREVMEKKGRLRGGAIWIVEDLTWKERRIK